MDGRDLHGRRPGQPRAGRGAQPGLSRPGQVRRDHRPDRGDHGRLSVRPDRGRGRSGAIVRQLGGQPGPGRVRALGDRPDRADRRGVPRSAIPTCRSSAFPRAPAASLRAYARETGVDAIGLDETVDPAWASARAARRPAGAGQSRSAGADRRRRGACRARSQRILDAFAGRPHIFNLGHGIQQTRRSRMSSS